MIFALLVFCLPPGEALSSVFNKYKGKAVMPDCSDAPKAYPAGKKLYFLAWQERWCITQPTDGGGDSATSGQYQCGMYDATLKHLILRNKAGIILPGTMETMKPKCKVEGADHTLFKFSGQLTPNTEYRIQNTDWGKDVFTFTTGAAGAMPDAGTNMPQNPDDDDDGCSVAGRGGAGTPAGFMLLLLWAMWRRRR